MQLIDALFIQKPATIFLVAGLFFGAYLLLRNSASIARPKALLWPASVWTLWAAWELGIVLMTPEADIRVDLFLILPLVLIVSVVGVILLFVRRRPA